MGCGKGFEKIDECSEESFFSMREFCCPSPHSCDAAAQPALNCTYETGVTTSCPSGTYEVDACKERKMCIHGDSCLYSHSFCW